MKKGESQSSRMGDIFTRFWGEKREAIFDKGIEKNALTGREKKKRALWTHS